MIKTILTSLEHYLLRKIGTDARLKIEELLGRKVFLQLRVKVRKNWRNDEAALNLFGFRH